MRQVKGKKEIEFDKTEYLELIKKYDEVTVDIGTGDGRFVYKNASENPNKLYVGVDTLSRLMEGYSKKARKNKLENAVYLIGSIEHLPSELYGTVDRVNITLPWGSLLKNIIDPQEAIIKSLSNLMKTEANLDIILGYDPKHEPSETARLNLTVKIDEKLIENFLAPKFFEYGGLEMTQYCKVGKKELENFETTWSKRLVFGNDRPVFEITFKKVPSL